LVRHQNRLWKIALLLQPTADLRHWTKDFGIFSFTDVLPLNCADRVQIVCNSIGRGLMGNMQTIPRKQSQLLEVQMPPPRSPLLDESAARFLVSILRVYGAPSDFDELCRAARPVTPPSHYQEFMVLKGWMDLDLADPDLAPLFEAPPKDWQPYSVL
jgi:hypothetical protein